jgi:hypothetical protein
MPRYFFHLPDGRTVPDDVGEEFGSPETAREHAVAVARELSSGEVSDLLAGRHIAVRDERGVVIFKISLEPHRS